MLGAVELMLKSFKESVKIYWRLNLKFVIHNLLLQLISPNKAASDVSLISWEGGGSSDGFSLVTGVSLTGSSKLSASSKSINRILDNFSFTVFVLIKSVNIKKKIWNNCRKRLLLMRTLTWAFCLFDARIADGHFGLFQ